MSKKRHNLIFLRAITAIVLVVAIFSCSTTVAFAKGKQPNITLEMLQNKAWHLKANSDASKYEFNVEQLYKDIKQNFNVDIKNSTLNNPIVAVIDSGLESKHPFFKDALWVNEKELNGTEGKDDDNNGIVDDINGANFSGVGIENDFSDCMNDYASGSKDWHGTHVAGIVHSVAPNAKIMPIKAGTKTSSGASFDQKNAVKALAYAIDNGANIINMSFGATNKSFAVSNNKVAVTVDGETRNWDIQDAINYAVDVKGCMVIAAAGNNGKNEYFYPASCNNVVSVMGCNEDKLLHSSSNRSENFDVLAPGKAILSSISPNIQAEGTHSSGGLKGSQDVFGSEIIGFADKNGTSMASPFVAGVAALLMTATNTIKASEITPYLTSEKMLSYCADSNLERYVLLDYKAVSKMLNSIESGIVIDSDNVIIKKQDFNLNEQITLVANRKYSEYNWYIGDKLVGTDSSYTFTPSGNTSVELKVNGVVKERFNLNLKLYYKKIECFDNEKITLKPTRKYTGNLSWYIDGKKVANGNQYTLVPNKNLTVELKENGIIVEQYEFCVKSYEEYKNTIIASTVGGIFGTIALIIIVYLSYKKVKINKINRQNNGEN